MFGMQWSTFFRGKITSRLWFGQTLNISFNLYIHLQCVHPLTIWRVCALALINKRWCFVHWNLKHKSNCSLVTLKNMSHGILQMLISDISGMWQKYFPTNQLLQIFIILAFCHLFQGSKMRIVFKVLYTARRIEKTFELLSWECQGILLSYMQVLFLSFFCQKNS